MLRASCWRAAARSAPPLSGEVDFLLDTFGTALTHHEAGRMRVLATCGERRSAAANVVALPSATPGTITDVVAQATRQVMTDEGMVAALTKMSIEPVADADADAGKSAAFFAKEIARWAPIVRASGVTALIRSAEPIRIDPDARIPPMHCCAFVFSS